ncbi:MAG: hypothetical protein IT306_03735 [Chloroflexi bacterium]|nr:hypothetical protein [Chloroflexota bacterium]
MARDGRSAARVLYGLILLLYPRAFRERLGASMDQTFADILNENRGRPRLRQLPTVLWLCTETAAGALKEQLRRLENITTKPRLAALVSVILSMPLIVLYTTIVFDLRPIERALKYMLTDDGDQPNTLGFAFMIGSLILLPMAFLLNLSPMLRRIGPDKRRALYPLNLIVGAVILVYLSQTWGALIVDQIACRSGVPNCD